MFVRRTLAAFCIGTFALSGAAFADVIIDTGNPTVAGMGYSLDNEQWLGGEITLGQAYSLTDIETFLFATGSGQVTLAIYGDGGDIPDTSSLFYSTTFSIAAGSPSGWYGSSGLDWDLDAGTYWVAFETANASAGLPWGTPNPLSVYAAWTGVWHGPYEDNWGLRVQGTPVNSSVVPEPATLTLCALGLVGFAGRAYRRRRKH